MAARSPLVNVMVNAAYKAAKGLIRDFGEVEHLQVSKKGPADFVSQADLKSEQILKRELVKARPDYGLLLEEGGGAPGKDVSNRWVVDPLDGTLNVRHGIPHFAISIGVERDGEPYAGVIYTPINDELYWAEKGQGAHLNERRLRVSGRKKMEESLIGTGAPFLGHGDHPGFIRRAEAVIGKTAGLRRLGAAALDLAYVASGRLDGFWEEPLNPWDICDENRATLVLHL